ncbi:hypothetical protein F4553_002990 [Allocatelliglobosispora scoriae]|uniref:Damage-control phosphatase ARMT1-like metal-binding domain-containing protein n=1 Tax=Allocatelliglobosispora scoriae TaxID=643052 RepID=A0A841BS24_9ACTN|nr:damage-control phosphatase ARMT1 family protein [Allocatelliglobosispora scoriae]MBB5869611.1 hypothetical protein [Allocatelliglobosispora scoriae]
MDAPEITSSEPGSFPWRVLHERHPAIIKQLRSHTDLTLDQHTALVSLGAEFTSGAWDPSPFLRAENYFYRRILAITRWSEHHRDPFGFLKQGELTDPGLPHFLDTMPHELPDLLAAAVWGNRSDLSFRLQSGASDAATGFVRDDRSEVLGFLSIGTPTVAYFADNAGRELIADLFLIDSLLESGLAGVVDLHVKPFPYFVSDVIAADLTATVDRLAAEPGRPAELAARLVRARHDGRLNLRRDAFQAAPMSFNQMPPEFEAQIADAGITILKGDLHYRRLVGDRLYPPTTSFAELTEYFPTPVLVLRTLKSEVITGLAPSTVAELDATGEPWRTTGAHALIQHRP